VTNDSPDDGRPPYDPVMAAQLRGKHLLVGLTYLNDDDTVDAKSSFTAT
jgi:hypothetical protein